MPKRRAPAFAVGSFLLGIRPGSAAGLRDGIRSRRRFGRKLAHDGSFQRLPFPMQGIALGLGQDRRRTLDADPAAEARGARDAQFRATVRMIIDAATFGAERQRNRGGVRIHGGHRRRKLEESDCFSTVRMIQLAA